jgi:cytochrome c-type biogenesis protein CcmE
MTKKRRRLYIVLFFLIGFGTVGALVLLALRDNISYFRTPSEVASGHYPEQADGRAFRLGGLVVKGSLKHDGNVITFEVTDLVHSVKVRYEGIPPDLFREGQGVVAEGRMTADRTFLAERLLAKHDEKYMPPEVAHALKTAPKSDLTPPAAGQNPILQ